MIIVFSTLTLCISPAFARLTDETLLTPLPQGFKIGAHSSTPQIDYSEYIPQGETVDDWSTMITVQTFHGASGVTPDAFAQRLKDSFLAACPGAEAKKSFDGTENGFGYSMWIMSCPTNPGTSKPEFFFMKVIRGQDALYDVQYAFRKDLAMELMQEAMVYLKKVGVCDPRAADKPCPSGM